MTYSAMSSFKGRGCLPSFRFSHEDSPPLLCIQRSGGGLSPFVIRIGAGCPAAARHPNKTPSFSAVCGERAFFIWNKAKENTICNTVLKIYNLLSSAAGMSANERPSCRIDPLSRGLCAAPCSGWLPAWRQAGCSAGKVSAAGSAAPSLSRGCARNAVMSKCAHATRKPSPAAVRGEIRRAYYRGSSPAFGCPSSLYSR